MTAELAGPTGSIHIEPLGIAGEVKHLQEQTRTATPNALSAARQ